MDKFKRSGNRRLSILEWNKVMGLLEQGHTYREVAAMVGVAPSTIWRAKKRGFVEAKPCGTYAGYHRHLRAKSIPCSACYEAAAKHQRDYKKRKKEAQHG